MDKTFTVSRLVKVINFRTLNGTIYAHKNFLKTYSTLTYKTKSILLFNQILGKLRLRWKFPPISFNEWVWLQRRIFLSSIVWRRKASVLKLNNINQIYILYLKYYPHIYFLLSIFYKLGNRASAFWTRLLPAYWKGHCIHQIQQTSQVLF